MVTHYFKKAPKPATAEGISCLAKRSDKAKAGVWYLGHSF